MKQYLLGAGVAAIAIAVAATASAVTFTTAPGLPDGPFLGDFRGDGGGDNLLSNPVAIDGITVAAEPTTADITQFPDDGLGVDPNPEPDEVDPNESLTFTLASPFSGSLTWGITDLFIDDDSQLPNGEEGQVTVSDANGDTTFSFFGVDSKDGGAASGNGEQSLVFAGLVGATSFKFEVPDGAVDNSDFSVAVVTPLPAAVWMFGAGLAGVAGAAYRRRNRAQAEA